MKRAILLVIVFLVASSPALAGDRSTCSISCVAPFSADHEACAVIDTVKRITRALADRDFVAMARYMDKSCSTFDRRTGKLVEGRDKVIADVKRKIAREEERSQAPIVGFVIDRPFARVQNNTAVVSFFLIKELGGANPQLFQSHCTDVFIKRGNEWKKLHYSGDDWQPVKKAAVKG